jgi:hypothetical protein
MGCLAYHRHLKRSTFLVQLRILPLLVYLLFWGGDLFKHTAFLEPACDGQHGYRVLLVSVAKKNICF